MQADGSSSDRTCNQLHSALGLFNQDERFSHSDPGQSFNIFHLLLVVQLRPYDSSGQDLPYQEKVPLPFCPVASLPDGFDFAHLYTGRFFYKNRNSRSSGFLSYCVRCIPCSQASQDISQVSETV